MERHDAEDPTVPAVVIGLIYAVSFVLPAWGEGQGWLAFICAMVIFPFWPLWAANPVFWFGLFKLFSGRWAAARKAGLIALLLVCSEGWVFVSLAHVGFYVWVASIAALAIAGHVGTLHERSSAAPWLDEPVDTSRAPLGHCGIQSLSNSTSSQASC